MKIKYSIGLLCLVALFSISYVPQSTADAWATKACRLTVVSETEAITECISQGTVCASVWNCFGIFNPGMG
jgi:hypothetical protein